MSINQEVALALDIQVFQDFGGVEHNCAGGAIEHGILLGKDIILYSYSIGCQEEDCLLAENDWLKPMDPIIVSSSDITVHNLSLLAIDPVGEKQQHIALGLDYVICDFPLTGGESFGADVHAYGKCASDSLLLGCDEIEVSKLAAFLGPQCIVVVEMIFAIVEDELACSIYHSS